MKDLTGQCKLDFEKWSTTFWKDEQEDNYKDHMLNEFYQKNMSMKFGVYQDFFDSVGIYVDTCKSAAETGYQVCCDNLYHYGYKTHNEARTAAINKANELYNQKNK